MLNQHGDTLWHTQSNPVTRENRVKSFKIQSAPATNTLDKKCLLFVTSKRKSACIINWSEARKNWWGAGAELFAFLISTPEGEGRPVSSLCCFTLWKIVWQYSGWTPEPVWRLWNWNILALTWIELWSLGSPARNHTYCAIQTPCSHLHSWN
jgi:hypothetical protein